MENLDGPTIFWLITLGMVIGAIIKVIMRKKGLKIMTNIIGGVLGTVIVGSVGIKLQIPGSLLLGTLGGITILFLANVFFLEEEHESA